MRFRLPSGGFLALIVLFPGLAFGQAVTGTIAGAVRDTTGGVLPGVTVEASSPALIEKTRAVVTDDQGLYKLINLEVGKYIVTFSLTGFGTVKREGIDVLTETTASVNVDLRVGAVEETITVSGAAPVVDVQNVVSQKVMTRDLMENLPTGKTFATFAVLVPGVVTNSPDVGGAYGDLSASLTVHGTRSSESVLNMDGMPIYNGFGSGGGNYGEFLNAGMMDEISVQTGSISTEQDVAGVRVNIVPKEGSDVFRGNALGAFTNSHFNSSNTSPAMVADGLAANSVHQIYDVNPSAGGAVFPDKLWYYLSFREWGTSTTRAGATDTRYYNSTPASPFYTPDLNAPAYDHTWHLSASDRSTWQISKKNKMSVFWEYQNHNYEFSTNSLGNAPETRYLYREIPQYIIQAVWSSPVTSRLLFEGGFTLAANDYHTSPEPQVVEGLPSITELSTNFSYRAYPAAPYGFNRSNQYNYHASASYVTGAHSFKAGFTLLHTWLYQTENTDSPNMPVNLQTLNGVPTSLTEWATPILFKENTKYNLGLYIQDQWKLQRLTMNLGVRGDFLNMYVLPNALSAGPYVPARSFPGVNNVPNWKDIDPRLGGSYDLFGDGKTAIKASVGRYVVGYGPSGFARLVDPLSASVLNASRSWTDTNGNFLPDCNLAVIAANGECGPLLNTNFGKSVPTTAYAPSLSQGFDTRPYDWEVDAGFYHELVPGLSVTANYVRRWYGNNLVTQNLALTNADYTSYCVTAPADPRLPGGGGNQECGFYDVNPGHAGVFNNLIENASQFGNFQDEYDGFDALFSARLRRGVVFSGGVTAGRERTNVCFALNQPTLSPTLNVNGAAGTVSGFVGSVSGTTSPNEQAFCNVVPPFQPNVKLLAVYPLPWGIQASGTLQSIPGPALTTSYTATNAVVEPSLGRNLVGSPGHALLDLIPYGTLYAARLNQTDVRLSKDFRIGSQLRVKANFDLYNIFNSAAPLAIQTVYGPLWQDPTRTLIGRLAKFGAQIDF
jgi:hypothetical protein